MHRFRILANMFVAGLRWILSSLGSVVYRPFAGIALLLDLRIELWIVDGNERSSGLPLSILCSAYGEDKNYVLDLMFGDSHRERYLGRFWLWHISKAIPATASGCSMVLAEILESQMRFTGSGDCLYIPTWVVGEVKLPRDAAATHKVSGDLRRIRRHGFQAEITRDPTRLDDFYHNMLVPYGTKRFGLCADLAPYERLKKAFPCCDLLLIKNQEQSIAGQLIWYQGECPQLWEMGVRDGNENYVKDGASNALYHFGLQHLQGKGYKKAWLGWSRPFLRNGVLQYKRKWSQKLTVSANYGFAFRVLSHTPATKAFLCNNPFIFKRDDRLFGAVFVDGDKQLSAEDIQQIDKDYFHPGLVKLSIYRLEREHLPAPNVVPPGLSERVEVCYAGDLLGGSP